MKFYSRSHSSDTRQKEGSCQSWKFGRLCPIKLVLGRGGSLFILKPKKVIKEVFVFQSQKSQGPQSKSFFGCAQFLQNVCWKLFKIKCTSIFLPKWFGRMVIKAEKFKQCGYGMDAFINFTSPYFESIATFFEHVNQDHDTCIDLYYFSHNAFFQQMSSNPFKRSFQHRLTGYWHEKQIWRG